MTRAKLFGGIAAIATLAFASPAIAQSYDWRYGDRYSNGYYDESRNIFSSRDSDLLEEVREQIAEVQANRRELRNSFFNSAMRNLRSIEDNIENARYLGGLNDRQYAQNRSLLNRTEIRINNELRTARRYYDDRYAYR